MTQGKNVVLCPHCAVTYDFRSGMVSRAAAFDDVRGKWFVQLTKCPSCENFRITIDCVEANKGPRFYKAGTTPEPADDFPDYQRVVYPFPANRPLPDVAPAYMHRDYKDAVATLEISPRASAATSRRCMQTIIREHFQIKKRTLFDEIDELKRSPVLPTPVIEMLHMLRKFGNFGAHPIENAGEIVDVEPEEAAFMLELLDLLIDQAYVRPAALARISASLEAKSPKKDQG